MKQTLTTVTRIDQSLDPNNLSVIERHRLLVRTFIKKANSLTKTADPPASEASNAADMLHSFMEIPFPGLHRHLTQHARTGIAALGQRQHDELTQLSRRIFSYIEAQEAATLWIAAALGLSQPTCGATFDHQQAEVHWRAFINDLDTSARIDRQLIQRLPTLRTLHVFEKPAKQETTRFVLDPQAARETLLQELELREAGARYIALGRY